MQMESNGGVSSHCYSRENGVADVNRVWRFHGQGVSLSHDTRNDVNCKTNFS